MSTRETADSDTPRTAPTTNGFGERLDRFGGRVDVRHVDGLDPCPECGAVDVDLWMHFGGSCYRLRCPECRTAYGESTTSGGEVL